MGKRRFRNAFAMLALALACRPACGGETWGEGYSRRVWRTEEGLPQNRVQAITQTRDGYLWIGTFEGLARFDGARFVVFDRSNTPALFDNSILSLEPAPDGSLWIGTEGGGLLHYSQGEFRRFGLAAGLTNPFVRALLADRRGTIWAGTDRGFFKLEGGRFVRLDGTPEIPLTSIKSIAEDRSGTIWAAGFPGLLKVDGERLVRADCGVEDRSGARRVMLLSAGIIGSGCEAAPAGLPKARATAILKDRTGTLWIGAAGHGMLRFDAGRGLNITAPDVLPDDTVSTLFEDRQHNIWVGMLDGLVRFSATAFRTVTSREGLKDDNVSSVYEDHEGTLWMVTLSGGIYTFSDGRATPFHIPAAAPGFVARTVFEDRGGALWIGGTAATVIRLDHGRVTRYSRADGLRGNTIRHIFQAPDGTMWFATDSGMNRWDGRVFTRYYLEDGLSYPSVRCLAADSRGDVLAGTDAGLNRIHAGRIVADPAFAALKEEKIWSIYADGDRLWLGTRGGGLVLLRNGRLTRLRMKDGLTSDSIYQILDDGRGDLWMSGPSGLSSVSRDELDRFAAGQSKAVHAVGYGRTEGMESTQMYSGIQPDGCRRGSGTLWFPTVRGAVRVDPRRIPLHAESPVLIERIVAGDKDVAFRAGAGEMKIGPGRARLAIDFTAPDLAGSQRLGFRYKLEGFDDDWIAAKSRTAYYSNLPPGHYRFRVIATNADARMPASEASAGLYLEPAFYQTAWFYAVCAALGLVAFWAALWMYARQTQARFALRLAERTRVAREMHDTVIQGCVGVSTLLEAASRSRRSRGAESGELLDEARAQIKLTLEEARQAVWDLRHYEEGVSAIERLFEFARKAGVEHGIRIETTAPGQSGLLDPAIDRALLLAGREAVRNAARHAHPQTIRLAALCEGDSFVLEVADDGMGFANQPAHDDDSHFGIQGMRERIEQTGGKFVIRSGPGGTTVRMSVPLGSRADAGNALNSAPFREPTTSPRFRGSGQ